MPIDNDMKDMLREANELTQAYRSEIADLGNFASELANLGSFVSEFGATALSCATGVATSIAVPTFELEVILSPYRSAMDGLYSVNSAKLCLLPLSHGHP